VQEQQLVEVGTSETREDSSVTLQSQRELVDEIMNHNLTQVPHNATSADLPPSSEPVVHNSSGLGLPTASPSVTATQSNVDSAALHFASPPPSTPFLAQASPACTPVLLDSPGSSTKSACNND